MSSSKGRTHSDKDWSIDYFELNLKGAKLSIRENLATSNLIFHPIDTVWCSRTVPFVTCH